MTTTLTRRAVLQGLGASTAAPLLPAAAAAEQQDFAFDRARRPQRALFQQQAYVDFDGAGAIYTAPAGNQSTVDYRAGLGETEFLRRHWFS